MTTPTPKPKPMINCSRDDDWKRNDSAVQPLPRITEENTIVRVFPSDNKSAYFEIIPRGDGPSSWRDFVMDAAKEWHLHGEALPESPEEAVWHLRMTAEDGGGMEPFKAPERAWTYKTPLEGWAGAFVHVFGYEDYEAAFIIIPGSPEMMARVRAADDIRPIALGML